MDYVGMLLELRDRLGVSRLQLSRLAGLPNSTIQNWESHGAIPSIVNYAQVLDAMGYEIKIVRKVKDECSK